MSHTVREKNYLAKLRHPGTRLRLFSDFSREYTCLLYTSTQCLFLFMLLVSHIIPFFLVPKDISLCKLVENYLTRVIMFWHTGPRFHCTGWIDFPKHGKKLNRFNFAVKNKTLNSLGLNSFRSQIRKTFNMLKWKRILLSLSTSVSYTHLDVYKRQINKSQGQTLRTAYVDLRAACFSHGQLYVACSRVSRSSELFICSDNGRTKYVVYTEALM